MIDVSKLSDDQLSAFEKAFESGIAQKIIKEAETQKVDPDLALALALRESAFKPNAHSPKDAYGIMQITPAFAKDFKIEDRTDIDQNIAGGIRGLKSHLDQFGGDKRLALIAYNAGPNAKFFETKNIADLPDETVTYLDEINNLHPLDTTATTTETPSSSGTTTTKKPITIHDRVNPNLAGTVGAGLGLLGGVASQGKKGIDYFNDRKIQAEIKIAQEKAAIEAASKAATPTEEELSGDKWNRKVVGSLGPGGTSSTEAAKNYRLQQSLSPEETSNWKASRSGLIVPNKLEPPPEPPKPPTLKQKLAAVPAQVGQKVGTLGNVTNRLPVVTAPLGGGGGAYMGAEAYNRFQKAREFYEMGRTDDALKELGAAGISGVGALGALASLVPARSPLQAIIKGGGALTATAAPAVLKAYEEYMYPNQ